MKVIGENRIADLWDRIKNYVDPKADKIPEVNHGTSDTTFTLTPNIMHIWGEVSSLTLSLPTDTNTVLDEYMFTFTCPSAAATTLTLPSTIKWIQEPNLAAGKTYQVSIINGLAGYLTDDMEIGGGDENVIEEIQVNGVSVPVEGKVASITTPQGTVTSVTVNGSNYTPDTNGLVNLGTISGGEGGTGGEYNVIEGVTFNGTTAPITNKIAAITYTAPVTSVNGSTGAVTVATPGTLKTNNTTAQTASASEALSGTINLHKVAKTGTYSDLIGTPTIPDAVTESTVSGWGFTKNVGTVTSVTINGTNHTPTNGIVDLGTVLTSESSLSKGTTSGSGNAVTDISVSGHTITLTKGSTFLTSHQNIKTINSNTLTGTGNISIDASTIYYDDGDGPENYVVIGNTLNECITGLDTAIKVKADASDIVKVYSGSSTPSNSLGSNGDIYIKTDISAGGEEE